MREGDESRDRIAGQADERRPGDDAHGDRPPGLDADAPEGQRAGALDRRPDVVLLPGRDAAGGDDQIVIGGRAGERPGKRARLVAQDSEVGRARSRAGASIACSMKRLAS